MIHHQLDYILTLIDPVTEGPVLGANQFYLNEIAIKPSKQLDNQFVFVNLLNNPKYFHVASKEALALLTWSNPHYKTLSVDVGAGESLHRVAVSKAYPFRQGQTLITIHSELRAEVTVKVPMACGRYHINGAQKGSEWLNLSASKTKGLAGRQFLITEAERSEQVTIMAENGLCQLRSPLENDFSEEALIEELLKVVVTPEEAVLVPLKTFDRGTENIEVELIYSINNVEKPLKVAVSSGTFSEVTLAE